MFLSLEADKATETDGYLHVDDGALLLEKNANVVGREIPRDVHRDKPRLRPHGLLILRIRLNFRRRRGDRGASSADSKRQAVAGGAGGSGDSEGNVAVAR